MESSQPGTIYIYGSLWKCLKFPLLIWLVYYCIVSFIKDWKEIYCTISFWCKWGSKYNQDIGWILLNLGLKLCKKQEQN